MLPINDLTPEEVREMFDYDPATGVLSWHRVAGFGRIKPGTRAGWKEKSGYLRVAIGARKYWAHRLVFMHVNGRKPAGCIDHINGDKADNRIENLRDVSVAVNSQNIKGPNSTNSHGHLGAWRRGKKWTSMIWHEGRQKSLGTFDSPEAASAAYLEAKRRLHPGCTI